MCSRARTARENVHAIYGRRPTTYISNNAEFGCSEENESCLGGFPELIYSVGGMTLLSKIRLKATNREWSVFLNVEAFPD